MTDIDEVNMFKDDFSVVHFKKPAIQFSVRENLLVVTGANEVKQLKEMMPDILKQVGPKQAEHLKSAGQSMNPVKESNEEDDDDVPDLVGTDF